MNYFLENIHRDSKSTEFSHFKQKFPFIKSMEREMEIELKQEYKKNKKVKPLSEEERTKIGIKSHTLTTTFYGNFDAVELDDDGII